MESGQASRFVPTSVLQPHEMSAAPTSRQIVRVVQQLRGCVPTPLLSLFVPPLVLFNEANLSEESQQIIDQLEGSQEIPVHIEKLSKILDYLVRVKLLMEPHARLYSLAAHQFTQTEKPSISDLSEIEEEVEAIQQFDWSITEEPASPEHRRTFLCTLRCPSTPENMGSMPYELELEVRLSPAYPRPSTEPPLEVELIRSRGLTLSQEGALQLLLDMKQELLVDPSLLNTLLFAQEFLQSLQAMEEQQVAQRRATRMEVPFMPPLHTLGTVQVHTKSLPSLSVSLLRVQQELIALTRKNAAEEGFQVLAMEHILQPAQLEAFIAYTRSLHQGTKPVKAITVGYHGASRPALESIVEFGMLSAGEFTREGRFIFEEHGALYGQGIYVSPKIGKALQYAYPEGKDSLRQVLVSLVSLGHALHCEEPYYWDDEYSRWYPRYEKKQDGYDAHVGRQQNEFTLFDSHQLLPVLLVTLGPQGARSESMHRQVERNKKDVIPQAMKPLPAHQIAARIRAKARKPRNENETKHCRLPFYKVPGSVEEYIIQFPRDALPSTPSTAPSRTKIHLITLIPQSKHTGKKAFGRYLLPACSDIHQSLQPDYCSAVFMARPPEKISPITSAAHYQNPIMTERPMVADLDIIRSYEMALDIALASQQRAKSKDTPEKILFIFVMFVHDQDARRTEDTLGACTRSSQLIISGNQLECAFRLVSLGPSPPGLDDAVQLSLATSTIASPWYPSVYVAQNISDVPQASALMVKDLQRLIGEYGNGYELVLPNTTSPFDGFLASLGSPPTCQCRVLLEEGDDTAVLYRGIPSPLLYMSRVGCASLFPRALDRDCVPFLLSTLQRLILDVKVAVIARRDVSQTLVTLRSILSAIKQEYMGSTFFELSTKEKATLVKQLRGLVHQVETQLRQVESELLLIQSGARSDMMAHWLSNVDTMKHGADALRRVDRAGTAVTSSMILKELRQLFASSPSLSEDSGESPSALSGWTATQHWNRIGEELEQDLEESSLSELLYTMGMTGRAIHVTRTESSAINPWNLIVDYVSSQRIDSASAMTLLDLDFPHHDETGQLADDVLVLPEAGPSLACRLFLRSKLYKAYAAVVFTRNYDVTIPGQHIALVMISFVKAIEQLMSPSLRTHAHLQSIMEMYLYLRHYVTLPTVREYWKGLTNKLFLPRPGLYLTEAEEDDVTSVVKVLAPLCFSDECERLFVDKELFPQLCDVALALLAEVTSRSCRVLVRRQNLYRQASPLIRQALGITERNTTLPAWESISEYQEGMKDWEFSGEFSETQGKKYSSRLFMKKWVNCSPQAVVACLGFARLLHQCPDDIAAVMQGGDTTALCSYFADGFEQVTMRNFIVEYVPSVSPMHLQIAMYVQGLKYHSSKDRKAGLTSLLDPLRVIQEIAKEERNSILVDYMNKKFQAMRQELRKAQLRQQQMIFLHAHPGLPTIFTRSMVDEMNQKRPPNDQLELDQNSGLIRHHCCFPACPQYLVNLATPEDRAKGTRKGIMRHLSPGHEPRRPYFRNFHVLAKTLIRTCATQKDFKERMKNCVLDSGARAPTLRYLDYLIEYYWCQAHDLPLPPTP